jgi:hypothetical protein
LALIGACPRRALGRRLLWSWLGQSSPNRAPG